MKKNRMMRLASGLLVAVLATTSMISGTYAKYVTTTEAEDTARVAKWGVTLGASGFLYSEMYKAGSDNKGTTDSAGVTVQTYQYTNVKQSVVAPGTVNPENGMSFTIDGRPEVAVALTGELNAETTVLPAAKYVVANSTTKAEGGEAVVTTVDVYTLGEKYYPVEYTLTKDGTPIITDGTLLAVCNAIGVVYGGSATKTETNGVKCAYSDTNASAQDYEPNTDLGTLIDNNGKDGVYKLTWKWDFENEKDVYDTFLGDLAYAVVGQDNSTISNSAVACYTNASEDTFYSVAAYNLLDSTTQGTLTAVHANELADYGIGITESFTMKITATQID